MGVQYISKDALTSYVGFGQ